MEACMETAIELPALCLRHKEQNPTAIYILVGDVQVEQWLNLRWLNIRLGRH